MTLEVILRDPEWQRLETPVMEFVLTYEGDLFATQRDPAHSGQPPKHPKNQRDIRRAIHVQMRRLWGQLPSLRPERPGTGVLTLNTKKVASTVQELAAKHVLYGYNFVPLVTDEMDLLCDLDILFLRPDRPGDVVWAGDIDNRVKTLLDALRIPVAGEGYVSHPPEQDETPFYCLLEDDKLITGLSVRTERLLEPVNGGYEAPAARVVISVRIRPYDLKIWNMHFG